MVRNGREVTEWRVAGWSPEGTQRGGHKQGSLNMTERKQTYIRSNKTMTVSDWLRPRQVTGVLLMHSASALPFSMPCYTAPCSDTRIAQSPGRILGEYTQAHSPS